MIFIMKKLFNPGVLKAESLVSIHDNFLRSISAELLHALIQFVDLGVEMFQMRAFYFLFLQLIFLTEC